MSITITPVRTRKDFLDFAHFSTKIYEKGMFQPWTAPSQMLQTLSPLRNPSWHHAQCQCFVAIEDGQPAGRIASVIDSRNARPQTGFFGAFEAVERQEAAEKLFSAAEEWLASFGVKKMLGPATFNTNQEVGLLIEGFEESPQPFIPYNPPYYQGLVEGCNLNKLTDLLSFHCALTQDACSVLDRIANRALQKKGLVVRPLNIARLSREAEIVRSILNQSMASNWGYIPLSLPETGVLLNYCVTNGDLSLVLVATINSEPAAFSFWLPGTLKTNYCARAAIFAVVPQFRNRGLESVLIKKSIETLLDKGYKAVEISQVEEKNSLMLKIIAKLSNRQPPTKRHRVYQKDIK